MDVTDEVLIGKIEFKLTTSLCIEYSKVYLCKNYSFESVFFQRLFSLTEENLQTSHFVATINDETMNLSLRFCLLLFSD